MVSRGPGFVDEVSEKGWEGYGKYLAKARKRLEDAPVIAKEDPYYYVTLLRFNLGEGASFEEMQKVFEAGQDKAPTFENLYF